MIGRSRLEVPVCAVGPWDRVRDRLIPNSLRDGTRHTALVAAGIGAGTCRLTATWAPAFGHDLAIRTKGSLQLKNLRDRPTNLGSGCFHV
jgi:hypothetical protein